MQKRKVELLAPAGNKEAFYGAIHAGADAVYLGGSRFGARAYADNFTEEELISCIRYAHIFGRKVYLTVNTLVKEAEFSELYDYLAPFYGAGLDGVIVQDIGVFTYIREQFPNMELHVSTQMTLTGKYGAELLKDMGACRVVPARELSLEEISAMKEATGLEIECFIHGAMCYCYSGQCLFSSILGGRSGNRGRCAQPCRLPYSVKGRGAPTEECYPLSLKDMCTIEQLPELIEAGIDSFKIEGRMKKPEYAAGVTSIYRRYIDEFYKNPHKEFKVAKKDLEKLSKLYIRSKRQNGYYHKHNDRDMVTLESPAYSGSDDALLADIRKSYLEKAPKLPVAIYASFQTGEAASVTYLAGDLSVTVTGAVVEQASKQPLSRENVEKQLGKLGGSVFEAEYMDISVSQDAFFSLKALNELRREAVELLENELIAANSLSVDRVIPDKLPLAVRTEQQENDDTDKKKLHISVRNYEQLKAVLRFTDDLNAEGDLENNNIRNNISRIYINGDMFFETNSAELEEFLSTGDIRAEIILSMPYILRKRDEAYLEKLLLIADKYSQVIKGFLVRNMEGLGYLKKKKYCGKIYGDTGFYMWNTESVRAWKQQLNGFCMPLELKSGEQRILLEEGLTCEKIFYGRIPMMITANCLAKTTEGCKKGTNETEMLLIDRYQKRFPVALNCLHCMNIIYNTVPLSLHNEWSRWKASVHMRLDFSVEGEKEVQEILEFFSGIYRGGLAAKGCKIPYMDYTTGHEKRGVE